MAQSSQVGSLLQALRDTQVFQAFQVNPIALATQYGVELTPDFAVRLQQNLQGCASFHEAQGKGQAGFRLTETDPTPDGWGGSRGGIACPGGRRPHQTTTLA